MLHKIASLLILNALLSGCGAYYADQVRAPNENTLEDARKGRDLSPRSYLRDGVFHMQRVEHGSSVRLEPTIPLKKPNLPPFDVAYINRNLESVVLELAQTAGESVVVPPELKDHSVTLIHSGADFREMMNLVLGKAGYHYNHVDGIWYVTRYPIRNYIVEIGQSTRKGGLIGKNELSAATGEGSSTNAAGTDISTNYTDEIWADIETTLTDLIKVGETTISQSGGTAQAQQQQPPQGQGLLGTNNNTQNGDMLPPPMLEGEGQDTEEQIISALSPQAEDNSAPEVLNIAPDRENNTVVTEKNAAPWFKITQSAGMITVRAAPEAHRQIETYLEQIQSSSLKQIVVEARIVALLRDKETDRGVQLFGSFDKASLLNGSLGFSPASELLGSDLSGGFMNLAGSDFTALIQSLSTLGDTYTLSRPSVVARNNQLSRVSVTRELGYVETEVETATGSTGDVSIGSRIDRAKFKNAGTVMSAIPFIGRNHVQLRFRLSVATQSGSTAVKTSIGDAGEVENTVPNLANNVIDQDMVLEYGRIYAIGGLIESSTVINESYEPTLRQIPGMQEIFRRAKNQREDTEFIVLIRVSRV